MRASGDDRSDTYKMWGGLAPDRCDDPALRGDKKVACPEGQASVRSGRPYGPARAHFRQVHMTVKHSLSAPQLLPAPSKVLVPGALQLVAPWQ